MASANKGGESRALQPDYAVSEPSVEERKTVTVLLMESGWGWATNESGHSGWVPREYLAALPTVLLSPFGHRRDD